VQIERLRKEGSRLVAEEQEKLQQQLRDDDDAVSRLYCDTDSGLRLRVCTPLTHSLTHCVTAGLYPAHSLTQSLCDFHWSALVLFDY